MTPEEVAILLLELQDKNAQLESKDALIRWFQNQLFGAKSERRILDELEPQDQLWLGEQMLDTPEEPPPPEETVRSYERKHRNSKSKNLAAECSSSLLKFDEGVPVQEIRVDDPELAKLDPKEVVLLDDKITHRLAQRSSYVILKYVKPVWRKKVDDKPRSQKTPSPVIRRSFADVSFMAELAVEKCCYHLPLYRQHQRLEQSGIHVTRSTLTRLLQRTSELVEPIYQAQLSSVLQSEVLAMDESPTRAGRGNGKMRQGYFWALYGDKDEVAFLYAPSRAAKIINSVLVNFEGTLLTDGYKAYEAFARLKPEVTLAGCWAHTRRHFVNAEKVEPQKVGVVLKKLQELYGVEEKARGKPKQLKSARDEISRPIVETLFESFRRELEQSSLLPSNPFIKAVEYAAKREAALCVFLENPELAIDTNHLERMIRPQVIGRKNWLFHTTEDGARHAGILYSLLQTCRIHDINPRTYLIDVLQRIDTHLATDIYQLTPLHWKKLFAESPMLSDVGN